MIEATGMILVSCKDDRFIRHHRCRQDRDSNNSCNKDALSFKARNFKKITYLIYLAI